MPSIFVLDDDVNLLFAINIILSNRGYNVRTFTNSKQLFKAIIVDELPDVILLDVWLAEEKDGKLVCKELKKACKYPNKIYLISASAVAETDLQHCHADGFIEKPFDLHYFIRVIDNAIT